MISPGWHGTALLWLLPWMVAPAVALMWRKRFTVGHGLRRWGLWLLFVCTAIQLVGHFMYGPTIALVLSLAPPPDPYPTGPLGYIVPDLAAAALMLSTGGVGVIGRFVGVLLVVLGFGRLVRVRLAEMGEEGTES